MSLLNSMLNDLDARTPSQADPTQLNYSSKNDSETSSFNRKTIILVCVICFCSVLAAQVFYRLTPAAEPSRATLAAENMSTKNTSEIPVVEKELPSVSSNVTNVSERSEVSELSELMAVEPQADTIAEASQSLELTRLLALAELAVEKNRLTLPAENNARYFFLKVLAQADAGSAEFRAAQAGMDRVEAAYIRLVESAIARRDYTRAKRFVARLDELQLGRADLARLESEIVEGEAQLQALAYSRGLGESASLSPSLNKNAEQVATASSIASSSPASPPAFPQAPAPASASVSAFTSSNPVVEAATGTEVKLDVNVSLISRDKTLAAKSPRLGGRNSMPLEREMLQFLDAYPNALHTRLALFEYYLDAGLINEAKWLLTKTSSADVNTITYLKAKLLVVGGEYPAALNELSVAVARDDLAPVLQIRIQALAAALSQQTGDHLSAFQLYRSLLVQQQNNSTYWLGLAVSARQLGEGAAAKQGFSRVLGLSDQPENILAYAKSELVKLRSEEQMEISQW